MKDAFDLLVANNVAALPVVDEATFSGVLGGTTPVPARTAD